MSKQATAQLARVDALEAHYTRRLQFALLRQLEAVVSAVEYGAPPELAAAYVTAKPIKQVLEALWLGVIVQEARYQFNALVAEQKSRAEDAEPGWLQRAKLFVQAEGGKAIREITGTTRKLVREILQTALKSGQGIPEAAKTLRQEIASLSRQRAATIARTELIAAANHGSYIGAVATGLLLDKEWIASAGSRTRPSHAACSGQTVAIQGVFLVGGYPAAYPGDPNLPAAERVRCRCTIGYRRKQ